MEWEEKSQVMTSNEGSNLGILVVAKHVAAALEDNPDCLDTS
jgi:hypothetical protein